MLSNHHPQVNRKQIVSCGGMVPLVGFLKVHDDNTSVDRGVLLHLADEKDLLGMWGVGVCGG